MDIIGRAASEKVILEFSERMVELGVEDMIPSPIVASLLREELMIVVYDQPHHANMFFCPQTKKPLRKLFK